MYTGYGAVTDNGYGIREKMKAEGKTMEYYQDRIKGVLSALAQAARREKMPIEQVRKKDIGYGERSKVLSDTRDWKEFDRFETWGGREVHACFAAKIQIPEQWDGKCVAVTLQTGATDIWNTDNPQFLVYINGEMICGHDMNHNEVILSECARGGEEYDYRLYAYSNSSQKDVFLLLDMVTIDRETEQLYYDMKVPYELAGLMKKDDIRRNRYFHLLNDAANHLNLIDTDSEEFRASVRKAEAFIKEALYRHTEEHPEVTVHSIGHTHIDVAWKWPLRQTREKVLRSFATVLYQMERYPEYKFMSSQPQLYQFVKEESPELYEKIKEKIAEGRWETEGAMWVEADCNLSSGESLVRQILYGKKFFRKEFGTGENKVLWLPDVFGYSAAMPQILKKSGIDYFMTTKIGWNEYNKIPNDTMYWKGIDGTEILTYFITTKDYITDPELYTRSTSETTYNGRQNANQVMGTWQRYQNKDINNEVLTCFGYGDGGGGPTIQMQEENRRLAYGLDGCPKTEVTFVRDFFEGLEKRLEGKKVPKWCGELYLEFHRGTYTSMARNKRGNRISEFLNHDAESLQVFLNQEQPGTGYDREHLRRVWELTLLNQFHDILPGSSIRDVYEDSEEQYNEILELDLDMTSDALITLSEQNERKGAELNTRGEYITLFNTTPFGRADVMESEGAVRIYDGDKELPVQWTEDGMTIWKAEEVPAYGYRVFTAVPAEESRTQTGTISVDLKNNRIRTPYYEICLNNAMEFTSLYDKKADRELMKEGQTGNSLLAYEDRPKEYDAWNIDPYYVEKCYPVTEVLHAEVKESGPVRTVLAVGKKFHHSVIEQEIVLYEESPRIDFHTCIDWKESQILLKAAFPLDLVTDKAVYEIQYGNVERPTHANTSWDQAKFEVCTHKWADVAEAGYGVAFLNDCKYGLDIKGTTVGLTLLKSGIFPNPEADREEHEFTYSLFPHQGDFREGRVVREAYLLNNSMYQISGRMPVKEQKKAYIAVSEENVVLETVKPAEESEDIILRFYEAHGQRTKAEVCVADGLWQVYETDLMEEHPVPVREKTNKFSFVIKPYEIKTFRLVRM